VVEVASRGAAGVPGLGQDEDHVSSGERIRGEVMAPREEMRFCPDCGRTAITNDEDHEKELCCWKCDIPMKFKQEAQT